MEHRMIYCRKLKKEAAGLSALPFPGPLGQRIYDEISQEAWRQWLGRQTMLINEYRLSLIDPQARAFLKNAMEQFLFHDDSGEVPPGYVPPEA